MMNIRILQEIYSMILFDSQNNEMSRSELPFRVGTLSQNSYLLSLNLPKMAGSYWLYTYAIKSDGAKTLCRRKIKVV